MKTTPKKHPMLLHEKRFLEARQADLGEERLHLGEAKAEAQGDSYDWHDNAPLDVIQREMDASMRTMQDIDSLIRRAEIVPYPEPTDTEVKLGTLVLGKDNFGLSPFIVVGQLIAGKEKYEEAWEADAPEGYKGEMLFVISAESPLGAAAIGLSAQQTATYETQHGPNSFEIANLDQTWIINHFSQQS